MSGGAARMFAAVAVAIAAGHLPPASRLAIAKPAASAAALETIKNAEALLRRLEYQRARALLEDAVRDGQIARARPAVRAKLWALLGRARAEMGDGFGSDEAFLEAMRLDRSVKLPRSTSPKILAALERARINAPVVEEKPPRDPAIAPPPPPRRKEPERVAPRRAPRGQRADARGRREKGARAPSAALSARIEGRAISGGRVRLVVEAHDLPPRAEIDALLRRRDGDPFTPERMTRTGTTAELTIVLDVPRIEVYARARLKGDVVALAGSPRDPLVIEADLPPPLEVAWAEPPASTATVAASAEPPPLVPAEPPPPAAAPAGLTSTEIWLFAGGGVALVAGVVATALILSAGSSRCDAKEGFGCTEITVVQPP